MGANQHYAVNHTKRRCCRICGDSDHDQPDKTLEIVLYFIRNGFWDLHDDIKVTVDMQGASDPEDLDHLLRVHKYRVIDEYGHIDSDWDRHQSYSDDSDDLSSEGNQEREDFSSSDSDTSLDSGCDESYDERTSR